MLQYDDLIGRRYRDIGQWSRSNESAMDAPEQRVKLLYVSEPNSEPDGDYDVYGKRSRLG